jgi:hypothetical protein
MLLMKRLGLYAAAVALLAASSVSALAAQASGEIASIAATAGTITLADGTVYSLSPDLLASLAVGQQVSIIYDVGADGLNEVNAEVEAGASGDVMEPAPAP